VETGRTALRLVKSSALALECCLALDYSSETASTALALVECSATASDYPACTAPSNLV
jgi:hypothetical protein